METSIEGAKIAKPWQDPAFAANWAEHDGLRNLLDFPRALSAALLEHAGVRGGLVLDVASGPGDFLAAYLSRFPTAQGIWTDASAAMLGMARVRLAPFGDRVRYELVDMTNLETLALPGPVDVLITSRASHHLSPASLAAFYRTAAHLLADDGWVVNLDHVSAAPGWDERFRAVRKAMLGRERADRGPSGRGVGSAAPGHHHDQPAPTLDHHLRGLTEAGLTDAEVAWKVCHTMLVLARRPVAA